MIEFYKIKDIAVQHFYSWENGEDFDWLRLNWSKFNLSSVEEAEAFIITAGYIYCTYVKEAFYLSTREGYQSIEEYCEFMGFPEKIIKIIKDKLLWTIDRILQVFDTEEKLNEEFLHITDEFKQAHPDALRFLKEIAK